MSTFHWVLLVVVGLVGYLILGSLTAAIVFRMNGQSKITTESDHELAIYLVILWPVVMVFLLVFFSIAIPWVAVMELIDWLIKDRKQG